MPKKNGFTLIELMVVIAIIAILAVVGISVYANAQKSARDGKRIGDIKAISNAIETAKVPTSTTYPPISGSNFTNNSIPIDINTDRAAQYCILERTDNVRPATPTSWSSDASCPTPIEGSDTTVTAFTALSTTLPSSSTTNWRVCVLLENAQSPIFCLANSQ